jgi:hypothetical protein
MLQGGHFKPDGRMSPLIPLLAGVLASAPPCANVVCDCIGAGTAREARSHADAVFVGVAASVRDTLVTEEPGRRQMYRAVTFRVRSGWKGVRTRSVTVLTGMTTCGFSFRPGESYLVYARRAPLGGIRPLLTSICTRTATERDAAADIRALARPEYRRPQPTSKTSR